MLLGFGIYVVSYTTEQNEFVKIICGYSIAFFGYVGILKYSMHQDKAFLFKALIALAIVLRILVLPVFPNLSDDIYRFIWDGYLIHNDINPLTFTPRSIIENGIVTDVDLGRIFPLLNSPDYFTIYPPISQAIFYVSTIFGIQEPYLCSFIIKITLLLSEIFIFFGLYKLSSLLGKNVQNVMIYALNPLVIIEIMTNLHFESIMVCFFIWTLYFLKKSKYIISSLLLSLSVAAKLLPLMFMPIMLVYLFRQKKAFSYLAYFAVFTVILFIPFFYSLDIGNFLNSLDLYFQKFEFNASVYYLLRALGKWITGYNQIIILGPLLGLTTVYLIFRKAYKNKLDDILDVISMCLFAFTTYLLLSTTVHPWYLILPIALCVFNPKRFVISWSFLITLSYSTYMTPDFDQNLIIISIEYCIVFLVWLLFDSKSKFNLRTN